MISELEQAVSVNCGEGRNTIFFESCNSRFGGIDPVIVGWDEGDIHMVASDVCFDSLGAFVVHYIERGCITVGVDVGKNVCEHQSWHHRFWKAWHGQGWHSGCKHMPQTQIACCRKIAWGRHQCHWCTLSWCVSLLMLQSKNVMGGVLFFGGL
jgi:hypothetical protein